MPGKLKSVGFTSPYSAEEAEIERRHKMAELLQAQGQAQLGPTEMVGGWAIPRSPMEGLGKAAQQISGAYQAKRATEMAKALRERQQGDRSADMGVLASMLRGAPASSEQIVDEQAQGGMGAPATINAPARPAGIDPAMLGQLRSPEMQNFAMQQYLEQLKPKELKAYKPGDVLYQGANRVDAIPAAPKFHNVGGNLVQEPTAPGAPVAPVYTAPAAPVAAPASIREYEYAKGQGFKGTFEDFQLSQKRAGASRLTVDNRAEGAYAQKVAGGAAERDEGQVQSAQAAVENLQKLDSVIKHLKTSDAITGLGSDVLRNMERAKVLFTQSKAAGKKVSDTELLDTMLGSDVFPMIKALGIGARGMDTPAEREFLRNVMTGTTALNKDTLTKMTEIRRDISKRAIERYNKRVKGGELDQYFRFSGMPKQEIEAPLTSGEPRVVDW